MRVNIIPQPIYQSTSNRVNRRVNNGEKRVSKIEANKLTNRTISFKGYSSFMLLGYGAGVVGSLVLLGDLAIKDKFTFPPYLSNLTMLLSGSCGAYLTHKIAQFNR